VLPCIPEGWLQVTLEKAIKIFIVGEFFLVGRIAHPAEAVQNQAA